MNRFRITLTVPGKSDEWPNQEIWSIELQHPEEDALKVATAMVADVFHASLEWRVSIDCRSDRAIMLGPGGRKLTVTRIEEVKVAA